MTPNGPSCGSGPTGALLPWRRFRLFSFFGITSAFLRWICGLAARMRGASTTPFTMTSTGIGITPQPQIFLCSRRSAEFESLRKDVMKHWQRKTIQSVVSCICLLADGHGDACRRTFLQIFSAGQLTRQTYKDSAEASPSRWRERPRCRLRMDVSALGRRRLPDCPCHGNGRL